MSDDKTATREEPTANDARGGYQRHGERDGTVNVYDFIRSRDVAEHCRKTGRVWNTFEMAAIIARSLHPMDEKHEAWRALIARHPDMPAPPNVHRTRFDSLHKKLAEIIDYEEKALALFKKPEPGAVYRYRVCRSDGYRHSDGVFSTHGKAFADAVERWGRDEIAGGIWVDKLFADDADREYRMGAMLDHDGNVYELTFHFIKEEAHARLFPGIPFDDCGGYVLSDDFYMDIPTPFKRGDILTFSAGRTRLCGKSPAFVLDHLDRDDPKRFERAMLGKAFDGSDLTGWGFYVDDSGTLYGDHFHDHDDLEYYRGKIEGKDRLLHYVGLYLKEEITLPALLTMQCRLMLEHQLDNDLRLCWHGRPIAEHLLAENLGDAAKEG